MYWKPQSVITNSSRMDLFTDEQKQFSLTFHTYLLFSQQDWNKHFTIDKFSEISESLYVTLNK